MARGRKNFEYESPIPNEQLEQRMTSSAGRKLVERLQSVGWFAEKGDPTKATPEDA